MIRFLFLIVLLISTYLYMKYHEQHPYFFIKDFNSKYNLVTLNFININKKEYIETNSVVVLQEDAIDLKKILEECYIDRKSVV